ncbi:MAG TPA: cupin domain-containing protein [Methylomirabilota bacterium]|jgi:quercetin dioxygenase-like cupin family protein
MAVKAMLCGALVLLGVLIGRGTMAHTPPAQITEQELLDNESVRIVLMTYPPGADSDLHLNEGPEITIVQDGELAVYAKGKREALRARTAHWLPEASAHLARNEGTRPARFWSILLKRCE